MSLQDDKAYLFVCGCPRSGTTVLTRLLSSHERVALGIERFGHLIEPEQFQLTPALFEKQRFFDLHQGDTFYASLDEIGGGKYYPELEEKYDHCRYIGDKRPELYRVYPQLFSAFPNANVFFIFRNIMDVAQSYKVRALKGTWPATKSVEAAVSEWNESLRLTLKALEIHTIHCIQYEPFFSGDDADISPLIQALGLEDPARPQSFFDNRLKLRARDLETERGALLSSAEKHYIAREADFNAYRDLIASPYLIH